MKNWMVLLVLGLGAWMSTPASAVVVCYNNVCGRIVCAHGCQQRSVNGRCVVNRCVGRSTNENGEEVIENSSMSIDETETPPYLATESAPRCN